ncbi:MAG: spore coat protein U domain-containing protein [Gammaproteobacteria bacterium]|nr:spore coat protein U domain-containing protein [Gammaproteobacteria bacterium]
MMRGRRMLVIIVVALLAPAVARAAASSCTVTSYNLAFGNYDMMNPVPTIVTGANLIVVKCSHGAGTMTVDLSTGGNGTYFPRAMRFGTNVLTYNLYTTAGLTTVWGNGSGGTGNIVRSYNNNSSNVFSVYGKIPAQQNLSAGNYSDSINITVSF